MSKREAIIASIGELSVTPRVIRHLSRFLKSPDEDMNEAIGALAAEPVLTAAILAACNAPSHYRGAPVLDLKSAVHRLGYRETYRIALIITFRQGLRMPNLPDSKAADYLWRRAATAACAMEEITPPGGDAPAAYTVGLLHLLGCFILARNACGSEVFDCANPAVLARAQAEACGISYPEAGALALERWEFPAEVWTPIRWQLTPHEAGTHLEAALQLSHAASIANFIETCRPDSPTFDPDAARTRVDDLARRVEQRSVELIESFYTGVSRRPRWAEDVLKKS